MAAKTSFLIFTVAFSGVATWTVDLPEVRKYFFEKHRIEKPNEKVSNALSNGEKVFDNIKADSPHNKPSAENSLYEFLEGESNDENNIFSEKYAGDFGYQTYKEKQVHSIVRDGSVYLEGLRGAIEQFADTLKQCQLKTNTTPTSQPKPKWLPENERPVPSPWQPECDKVEKASEHVRRLAELALWATNELQDRAYNGKHEGPSAEEEEKELLLRLAWFLDRLATLTGYRPQPSTDTVATTSSTTTPQPATFVPSSQEIVDYLLHCIKRKGDEPATDRCRYPLTLPENVQKLFNVTEAPPSTTQINNHYPNDIVYLMQQQQSNNDEVLELQETKHSIQKRAAEIFNPAVYLLKYYVKHKVWENDNPITPKVNAGETFEVQNHLTDSEVKILKTKEKRSIDSKKSQHFRLPENPMQDLSNYMKHKSGVHIVKDEIQAQKFKHYLDKIRKSTKKVAKNNALKLEKSLLRPKRLNLFQKDQKLSYVKSIVRKNSRPKRSVHYKAKIQPRIPENPMQDISYYIKSKRGTNLEPSVQQASLYRQGLEQIFQTGNIEVVRRYGSNYNPAVPNPLMAGILASYADV